MQWTFSIVEGGKGRSNEWRHFFKAACIESDDLFQAILGAQSAPPESAEVLLKLVIEELTNGVYGGDIERCRCTYYGANSRIFVVTELQEDDIQSLRELVIEFFHREVLNLIT